MMNCEPPFSQSLLVEIRRQYRLDWNGLHGASHWARVLEKGLHLCAATPGLRRDVVVLFALLHDACRYDDGHDGEHGARAAEFVRQLHGRHIHLDSEWLGTPTARDPATVKWATQRAKERAFPWSDLFAEPDLAQFVAER